MGVRILDSEGASTETGAVLFDSVSGFAFGPVFDDYDEAHEFLEWAPTPLREVYALNDVRQLTDSQMEDLVKAWHDEAVPS